MAFPALVAVDADANILRNVETQLVRRYGSDYRVECLGDTDAALQALIGLRDAAVDVALVLVGQSLPGTALDELLDHVRQLHPHAKRVLLVAANAWMDPPTAGAIRAALVLGRIDYHVPRPAASHDEVFHEAVSDFLLEWARERRLVPQTITIVGEAWSGRAYEPQGGFLALRRAACVLSRRLERGARICRKGRG